MNDLLFFFIPKFVAGLITGVVISHLYIMYRKKRIDHWIYFGLVMAGYNIVVQWTWGWLQHVALVLMLLCVIGMFVAQACTIHKMRNNIKQWDAQRNNINDLIRRLDETYTHWDCGELSDEELDILLQEMRQEREKQREQEMMMMVQ